MKNKLLAVLILSTIMITGCAKYEKDESFNTDLYGTYSDNWAGNDEGGSTYFLKDEYVFGKNNTYNFIFKEDIDGEINQDVNKSGDILSSEQISDDITKIILDNDTQIYKYKNMLGNFYEVEVPDGKTFNIQLEYENWFDEDGQWHNCIGEDNCDCSENFSQYIRKNNIIYFKSINSNKKNIYSIGYYIVDNGVFYPEYTKEK